MRCNPYIGRYIFTFLVALFILESVKAQRELEYRKISPDYLESYLNHGGDILVSPYHWNTKEWFIFTGTVGLGITAYQYDLEIYEYFQQQKTPVTQKLTKFVLEPLGNPYYWAGALGGTYIVGEIADNKNTRAFALTAGKALVLNGIITFAGKHLTHRARPFQGNKPDPGNWNGPFKMWQYNAFPSGHTSTAFTMATVFSEYYKDKKWVTPVAYTLATFAGLSRIHDEKHWPSDVVIGAAVGYGIGKLVMNKDIVKPESNTEKAAIPPIMVGFTIPLGKK